MIRLGSVIKLTGEVQLKLLHEMSDYTVILFEICCFSMIYVNISLNIVLLFIMQFHNYLFSLQKSSYCTVTVDWVYYFNLVREIIAHFCMGSSIEWLVTNFCYGLFDKIVHHHHSFFKPEGLNGCMQREGMTLLTEVT